MSLTNEEIVRLGCGDTQQPYILSSAQIEYYLTINSDNTVSAIDDAKAGMVQILAVREAYLRTENLIEDTRDRTKAYIESIEKSNSLLSKSAYPVIGGCDTYRGNKINQFDDENNWESISSDTDYYNDIDDL